MSEYQYYEFRSLDRALTSKEQEEISSLSRRANVTAHAASFTYSYADFPGDVEELMTEYFDAMLYMANWGTRQLIFRIPRGLVDVERVKLYCVFDGMVCITTEDAVLINLCFDDDRGSGWIEGEGWLDKMLAIRQELINGDFRALYLAWLKAAGQGFDFEDEDDIKDDIEYGFEDDVEEEDDIEEEDDTEDDLEDVMEPPVPSGLKKLSPALEVFAEFMAIDPSCIEVAAKNSEAQKTEEPQFEKWIDKLSEAEQRDFLVRLSRGEAHLSALFNRRLGELAVEAKPAKKQAAQQRRTIREIVEAAKVWQKQKKERERAEKEEARRRELEALAAREKQAWQEVDVWIGEKTASSYGKAVALLVDLRDLAASQGNPKSFQERIARIIGNYPTRPALLKRMREAGL